MYIDLSLFDRLKIVLKYFTSSFMSIELIVFAGSGSVAGKSTFVINNLPLLSSKEPLSLSFIVTCTGGAN